MSQRLHRSETKLAASTLHIKRNVESTNGLTVYNHNKKRRNDTEAQEMVVGRAHHNLTCLRVLKQALSPKSLYSLL